MLRSTIQPILTQYYLTNRILFTYIKNSKLNSIKKEYNPETNWQKIKMYTAMFRHIAFQGMKLLRNDISLMKELNPKKSNNTLTQEEKIEYMRVRLNISKLGPLFIIQFLPFSGPLFLGYMYTYPESIPSWFLIDKFHNDSIKNRHDAQINAAIYFQKLNKSKKQIDPYTMSLQQLRKLSQLCIGYYRDGTRGYNKLFPDKKLNYFVAQNISKNWIIKKLKLKFRFDIINEEILKDMSFEDKIRWKYQQIMVHKKYHVGHYTKIDEQVSSTVILPKKQE